MQLKIGLLLAGLMFFAGCGGSSSSSKAPAAPGALSGNWQMGLLKTGATVVTPQSGFLLQSGDAITGGILFSETPCTGTGSVNGTVTGAAVSLTAQPTGVSVNLTGTVGTGQTSMSGAYTILSQGCNGSGSIAESGNWSANLVAPLKGNIQGSFTSKHLGTSWTMTGQLTQGANTGASTAAITGTLNTTGYCFTSANIQGVISGTSVVLNLVNPDGTPVGLISAATSLDGTTLVGTYNIDGLGSGGLPDPPCVNGDSGTVTLTL